MHGSHPWELGSAPPVNVLMATLAPPVLAPIDPVHSQAPERPKRPRFGLLNVRRLLTGPIAPKSLSLDLIGLLSLLSLDSDP